jgi:hypothetical protein
MKLLSTILTAAVIAGSSTVAMAQGEGAGGDLNPNRVGRGTDENPTGAFANPRAGNSAAPPWERYPGGGQYRPYDPYDDGMTSSNVSGRWNDRDYHGYRIAPNGTVR